MVMIGIATGSRLTYLFETPGDGQWEFEKRELVLEDPGFDVSNDEALEMWALLQVEPGLNENHFTVWRNVDRNVAGVAVYRGVEAQELVS
jgi:hypothetical protein